MKNILILANGIVGLHNFRFEIVENLINNGFNVHYSVPESSDNYLVKLFDDVGANLIQIRMERRGINPIKELMLMKNYKNIIKKINPDCILTFTIKPNIYGNLAASKHDIPVISNITGLGTSLQAGKLKKMIIYLYKLAYKKTSCVFFENKSNQSFFIKNKMVDDSKTKLLPGAGVNLKKFTPIEKKKEDGIIRFLFIGRLMREKGLDEFLEAASQITGKHPNVEFQILGSFEEAAYKDRIEANRNPRINYLGYSKDTREQIKNADCIVHPSYHEGMSNVLLESAAMGKPLIASNIPGCKEIIDNNKNGYLVQVKSSKDLVDKLLMFIALSHEKRLIMGENSRKKVVTAFDRQIVVDQYLRTIKSLTK